MSDYRRARGGSTYFFTVVTYMRQPILCLDYSLKAFEETTREVRRDRPFELKAWVVLPDHIHAIWELPDGDSDFSTRWALIKKGFTKKVSGSLKTPHPDSSRIKRREGTVWQRRFWEHKIRDDADLSAHVEYIHYNPVKHGLASAPREWVYSSFREYVEKRLYAPDWGGGVVECAGIGAE
ncbi:MAG: transposase [Thermodesulfobacteriota bacterium]|nr:MAG: transposase [Thermodesulfobacteriota bacterium]